MMGLIILAGLWAQLCCAILAPSITGKGYDECRGTALWGTAIVVCYHAVANFII